MTLNCLLGRISKNLWLPFKKFLYNKTVCKTICIYLEGATLFGTEFRRSYPVTRKWSGLPHSWYSLYVLRYIFTLILLFQRPILVMGHDQNLCESSMNMISRFTICGNHEIRERQFPYFS